MTRQQPAEHTAKPASQSVENPWREWQPIETAPKDGTEVLLCGRYDATHKAAWINGRWISMGCDGWAISSQSDFGTDYQESGPPTHWMPLPEPPK